MGEGLSVILGSRQVTAERARAQKKNHLVAIPASLRRVSGTKFYQPNQQQFEPYVLAKASQPSFSFLRMIYKSRGRILIKLPQKIWRG